MEGKLAARPFEELADAVLATPSGRNLAVRLSPDGTFRIGPRDILPAGQFLSGAVLSDEQQRRQNLYREFLRGGAALEGRNVLLAWAKPVDTHFKLVPDARTVGTALLVVPFQIERPTPGETVTVPGPLIPCRRIVRGGETRVVREAREGVSMHLRFQVPPAVLPLKVERARLAAKINAPSRQISITAQTGGAGGEGGENVEIYRTEGPLDPLRIDIADERLLRLDKEGGLHLTLTVSDPLKDGGAGAQDRRDRGENWLIEYLELEVTGRTPQ
jgi:hypothetical protein